MDEKIIKNLIEEMPLLQKMQKGEEVVWINPDKTACDKAFDGLELTMTDVDDAEARLNRFAPFIMRCFPETVETGGIIESELVPIPEMQKKLNEKYGSKLEGKLLLKKDSHLAIAGSIKARGGIYEVLKHTEELALENGIITIDDDYSKLADPENREFFSKYMIQVGSTGNLGMSIGIMSAAIGYEVIVHMSADAKQWKKDLLRSHGVTVKEYESDYSVAVENGRKASDANPMSYFVDDENSRSLFLGYAVAAKRLVGQLEKLGVSVDAEHPLFTYIPCGVGGAPGGVTFGIRQIFKDAVHCFFVEPTEAPCVLVGMATGYNNDISVQDIGLSGVTHADGLAVGRPSGFVGGVMKTILSGSFTVEDAMLYEYMRDLLEAEEIFLEPSACASFEGPAMLNQYPESAEYIVKSGLLGKMANATHIAWATGGSLVPEATREEYKKTYLK